MKINRISIAALFLVASASITYGQVVNDTVKNEKELDSVTIRANTSKKTETAVLQEIKKATVQKQAVGAEEISRKGISNVEQGLTKVTGITTVEGRGLFVRGLEERYNTLLVNGLGTPSNNPFQKIIALKQFPTDVVGKLNIYKTFNSNLYADFAGATFDIETLTYDRPFTKIEFSAGYNTQSTLRDFKINPNATTMRGFIGLNSKERALPAEVKNYRPSSYTFNQEQSLNSFKEGWDVENIKALPNTSIGVTTAQKFRLGGNSNLGFLLSLNHGSSYQYREGVNKAFRNNGSIIDENNHLYARKYIYELETSAILALGLKVNRTNINLNAIFLQNADNIIENQRGFRDGGQSAMDQFFSVNQLDISKFADIQLLAEQKVGERHTFRAGGSWVNNHFEQPDRKIFYGLPTAYSTDYTVPADKVQISYGGNNFIRQYLDVNGKNYLSAFGEYIVGLGSKEDRATYPVQITLGYNGFEDIRNTSYRFIFNQGSGNYIVNVDKLQSTLENSIRSGEFTYKEGSTQVYRSNIYQFVNAGYLNLNYKPNNAWDILVGGRVENNMNITRYKELKNSVDGPFQNLTKNQWFILPSLAAKYALTDRSNIRFSASKTITRPILIEYMPIEYINPDNKNIFGNKNLENSENYNVDLKYEVFPTSKEMFSANLFAKRIMKPIETSFMASGNSNGQTITFFNAKSADIAGIELEGILALSRLAESLDKWTLGANATVMYSNVERNTVDQALETDLMANRKRKLQGAAPWVLNADLKYEFKNSNNLKHTASLVYNVSGKKIYGVGWNSLDNVYENPFHQLDFIYNAELTKNWNVKLGVLNILNSEYRLEMGENSLLPLQNPDLLMENYKRGTTFNITLGYTF